ncbi:glycosyltransferase [uncultured Winogradskyella sp.]
MFNCSKVITATIESVKSQSYKNWELILIDDASTD